MIGIMTLVDGSGGQHPVLRRLAEEHGIPARFLVQILLQLKNASLVVSTRGAQGGTPAHELTPRPSREVALLDDAAATGFATGVPADRPLPVPAP